MNIGRDIFFNKKINISKIISKEKNGKWKNL